MASWKKFKGTTTGNEIKISPIYSKKELSLRKNIGVGIEIEGNKIILDDIQIKELICYLIRIY